MHDPPQDEDARIVVRAEGRLGDFSYAFDLETPAPIVGLMGPNGSGKTTLLRLVVGDLVPPNGRIEAAGAIFCDTHSSTGLPIEERHIGYLPQPPSLFRHMTVQKNLTYGLSKRHPSASQRDLETRARQLLKKVTGDGLADARPTELSSGETQKVALARALSVEPDVLVLDEPFAAVDASARPQLRRIVVDYVEEHAAVAMVATHDIRDVVGLDAQPVVLADGEIVQSAALHRLYEDPANEFVAELTRLAPRRDARPDKVDA